MDLSAGNSPTILSTLTISQQLTLADRFHSSSKTISKARRMASLSPSSLSGLSAISLISPEQSGQVSCPQPSPLQSTSASLTLSSLLNVYTTISSMLGNRGSSPRGLIGPWIVPNSRFSAGETAASACPALIGGAHPLLPAITAQVLQEQTR